MALDIEIPGAPDLHIAHVLFDLNGTLTNRGALLDGVSDRVRRLHTLAKVELLSADTFGSAAEIARQLDAPLRRVDSGEAKRQRIEELGASRCAAVGNGANDAAMLQAAALGIAVLGPEGLHGEALRSADVVRGSAIEALALLLDARSLMATLRP